ncbi:hypothetical protein BY996DRAFT_6411807 [Phakopsora pachyrhizi]|nr:hypothetical protein BY996DRAFT_6411807 [Phakopsora pachyrhizi]
MLEVVVVSPEAGLSKKANKKLALKLIIEKLYKFINDSHAVMVSNKSVLAAAWIKLLVMCNLVTFIVCVKIHKIRFEPHPDDADSSSNSQPGTIVDKLLQGLRRSRCQKTMVLKFSQPTLGLKPQDYTAAIKANRNNPSCSGKPWMNICPNPKANNRFPSLSTAHLVQQQHELNKCTTLQRSENFAPNQSSHQSKYLSAFGLSKNLDLNLIWLKSLRAEPFTSSRINHTPLSIQTLP